MTRLLTLALLAALPCLAVTASPASITTYMRKGYPIGTYPYIATRLPIETTITISGTGDWNIARGGNLATACGGTWCFTAVTAVSGTLCSGTLPTGNGPGTVILCWRSTNGVDGLALGDHTGTLTIGSTVINLTLTVVPALAFDAFVYKVGYPSGCTNSNAGFPHADTCTVTNERPTSTAFSIPGTGACYTDAQFGHQVCRVTPPGFNISYSTIGAFSPNNTFILVTDGNGAVNVYNRTTAALAFGPLSGSINIAKVDWDSVDNDLLWYMDGTKLFTHRLSTAVVTEKADYALASGSRPALGTIEMGGTSSITDDNWWAFYDSTTMCAVKLTGLSAATQESQTFCGNISSFGFTHIDFAQISDPDRGNGKRYVLLLAAPATHVWSVGATALTYEYQIPTGAPDMTVEPHSEMGRDPDGNVVFFYAYEEIYGNQTYLVSARLSAGTLLLQPVEIGGGMKFLYPKSGVGDNHFGCNGGGTCMYSTYSNTLTARRITSVTAANPCQISTSPTAHGYTTGNTVQIGGALGITSINGDWVVTSTGANTYTLDGHNCTGTYTANSAHSAAFTAFSNAPNRQEIAVLKPGHSVRRLAIHRNSMYEVGTACAGGDECSYFNSPRASISDDGRYIAYACNFGKLANLGVCVADTGYTSATQLTAAVLPADTSAVLNYDVPASQGAATILISAAPGLGSPVVNASDSLTGTVRQYVATGLTAATRYYYRISAGEFSHTGRFLTQPALSGNGTLRLEKGGGGTIDHGATSALGSSGASPLNLTPSKGVYYYNAGAGITATVVH